jgi:acyl-CoA thioesterase-1
MVVTRMSINSFKSINRTVRVIFIFLVLLAPVMAHADQARLLVLGDSLVAGYGLPPGQSLPDQLQRDLATRGVSVAVINAGVSGDTTAGGLARLDWSLADNPDAVIIVLGGNDMLRGLPPEGTATNLDAIVSRLRERDIEVLLAGMMAPRNLGPAYVEAFDAIYPALARRHDIEFYPFFLDGVALDPALNLDDGLHPNMQGISEISRRMLPVVERLLARLGG